ncbi:hypothetical protein CBR_g29813 [Chara braunii]|uniref:Leucine carboxyl methyltransferase 1 homolog n=1 Tax=Chara braunii TaxID=69332 RepID=A0A388LBG3_CHABU|nr:hypothetical protein CBR_g29813 [Chara braunii]|eukprot:GBG79665.1 hypothetical protein CBR_g29813 [Chara braunii]
MSVQGTNDDATLSKMSCIKKGYITNDNFVQYFVRRPTKRSPIINRGYYARWAAIRGLILQFLSAGKEGANEETPKKQILSLGAGFDTVFFQLKEDGKQPHRFYEIDFLEVTSRKAGIIGATDALRSKLGGNAVISKEQGEVTSNDYCLLPADLRDLTALNKVLDNAGFDPSLPTLVLAECVLIYLDPQASRSLIKWGAQKLSTAVFIIYEQMRGCPLLGIDDTPTLRAKEERFTEACWQRAVALNMDNIYSCHLDRDDIRRIERLEIFDEFEEWHIMQEHYCIAYGIKDQLGILEKFGFSQ